MEVKPELVEQINDVIKDSGSFVLSAPPALEGSFLSHSHRTAAETPSI